ncbi:nascent polypeptide-associated complex, alpha subunit [Nadsonia fulvescens var. elongata DSM 6958]|uniref:Nascent polypeptide-associated complex subunit alpha n=1 Tax=Nadsonia fulvescens var. elongata DSM 6958 TaxID=857566 RepID=A0A1E3PG51_9ASCO|nr:nascent polypeptide-associated complex, alpha subunit [Nadsonia fulvescens var. elongata DSM 6958]
MSIEEIQEETVHQQDNGAQESEIPQGSDVSVVGAAGEKKAKKIILKLGLVKVEGITRVTMKRTGNVIFAIDQPEVYKNPTNGAYVVFGEAKVSDLGAMARAAAAQNQAGAGAPLAKDAGSIQADMQAAADSAASGAAQVSDDNDNEDGPVDETGLSTSDIELVMDQTNASRAKVVKALRANDNDIVNTVMELTA